MTPPNLHIAVVPANATPATPGALPDPMAAGHAAGSGEAGRSHLPFKELLNPSAPEADLSGSPPATAAQLHALPESGGFLPGGNVLPPVLPPLPLAVAVSPAAERLAGGGPTSDASIDARLPAHPQGLPSSVQKAALTGALTAGAVPGGEAASPEELAMVAEVFHAQRRAARHEITSHVLSDALRAQRGATPEQGRLPEARLTHELVLGQSPAQRPSAAEAVSAARSEGAAVPAGITRLTAQDEGAAGATLHRLLASFTAVGDARQAAQEIAAATVGAARRAAPDISPPAPAFDAAVLGLRGQTPPPTAAQSVLRELRFERVVEGPTPASTAPAHTLGLPSQPAALAPDTPVLQLAPSMQNKPEWADGLGERIIWMTQNHLQNAQIRLNPPHLGPIEVQVSVAEEGATISFTAHHAATREALEAAAPRLRELLGSQGFGTVNVNIQQQASGERSAHHAESRGTWLPPVDSPETSVADLTPAAPRSRTLIDAYA